VLRRRRLVREALGGHPRRYVAGRDDITEEAADRWAAEQHELGEQGEFFFACIQFCFTATRSS
jgi:hypothetical protein